MTDTEHRVTADTPTDAPAICPKEDRPDLRAVAILTMHAVRHNRNLDLEISKNGEYIRSVVGSHADGASDVTLKVGRVSVNNSSTRRIVVDPENGALYLEGDECHTVLVHPGLRKGEPAELSAEAPDGEVGE